LSQGYAQNGCNSKRFVQCGNSLCCSGGQKLLRSMKMPPDRALSGARFSGLTAALQRGKKA